MSLQNLPDELKAFPNWTGWNGENRKPLNLRTGGNAQSDNSATWSSFDVALKKCDSLTGEFDGAGIAVPAGYVGFDFDGIVKDGVVEPFVQVVLRALRDPYCELSPSESGLRAFVRYDGPKLPGTVAAKDKDRAVEIFSGSHTNKILTVTGNHVSGHGIPVLQNLDAAYALCTRLTNEPFKKLWLGDITAQGNDDSKADFALLCMLAELTNGNAALMETYFNTSVRGQREKWTSREDYRKSSITAALKTWAQKPDYTKTGEKQPTSSVLQKAREAARLFDINSAVFNPDAEIRTHEDVFKDFMVVGDSALVVGAKKAEKSLFGERLAMHIACGKSWCGFACAKPRKVAYLDGENGLTIMLERWKEMLQEFTPSEQVLIRQNLVMISGREYELAGNSLDYLNDAWWDFYASQTRDCEVHFLDCLYLFHDKEPYDNVGLREVMGVLRYRVNSMGPGRTVVMLHHSRSLSNDDLKKVESLSLERLGALNFSEQSFGGKVLLKEATLVICLDRCVKKDADNEIESQAIHFQFYSRQNMESPLLKFEAANDKYARTLVRELTKGARKAALAMHMARGDRGTWLSLHEAAKDMNCARSNAYRHLNELRAKAYLALESDGLYHLNLSSEMTSEIVSEERQHLALQDAKVWLLGYVMHPMKMENVITVGDEEGHSREHLIRARVEVGLVEETVMDTSMVGTLMWRPKQKRGLKKGSPAAKAVSQKGIEARQGGLPVEITPWRPEDGVNIDPDGGPELGDLEHAEPPEVWEAAE